MISYLPKLLSRIKNLNAQDAIEELQKEAELYGDARTTGIMCVINIHGISGFGRGTPEATADWITKAENYCKKQDYARTTLARIQEGMIGLEEGLKILKACTKNEGWINPKTADSANSDGTIKTRNTLDILEKIKSVKPDDCGNETLCEEAADEIRRLRDVISSLSSNQEYNSAFNDGWDAAPKSAAEWYAAATTTAQKN